MTQKLIHRALSSIAKSGARILLIGGQACVFYGAAELSRDIDLLIYPDSETLDLLRAALQELQAVPIAVPDLSPEVLLRGHAAHFRCKREDVAELRIDVMAVLRNCDGFEKLWQRRTVLDVDGMVVNVLATEDLVQAKKTQRDKDWPTVRRLVEESYLRKEAVLSPSNISFWLRELRTPELLIEAAKRFPEEAADLSASRPALRAAIEENKASMTKYLAEELALETERDIAYWEPLKKELEAFRAAKRIDRNSPS
ncbi:MAG: hypothetical protein FJW38_07910 [Acidobacteria bacterium]|nr:hypothetical protein [Acidobacteriota bacterium]